MIMALEAKTVGKKTMRDVWDYFKAIIKADNNTYKNGKWGQFNNGVQQFDCVCTIKACGWGVPINKDITANQYDYIAKNKKTMPDVSIAYFYNKATKRGTDMSKIPNDILTFVYKDTSHIGIYNPATGTVCETCAGATMGTIERPLKDYPKGYWNKWSNGYYFTNSEVAVAYPYEGYLDVATENTACGWCYNGVNDNACTVTVKIFKGGKLIKSVVTVADTYRADLKNAKKGNGKHGFNANIDLNKLGYGVYTIKAYAQDGTKLINEKNVEVKAPIQKPTTVGVKAGAKCLLNNVPVYSSEKGSTIGNRTGTYYAWDETIINGRVRVTNSPARVGVKGQVSFWVEVAKLK